MSLSIKSSNTRNRRRILLIALGVLLVVGGVVGFTFYNNLQRGINRFGRLRLYWADPERYADYGLRVGERCGEAPFLIPTDGFIGVFWGDSFRPGRSHQGLDIFGPTGPDGLGETPVISAYDGYLTRLPEWRSAVIIRIPEDPLQPGRQIWMYYTHLADKDGNSFIEDEFPPGTFEMFIPAGTLLGYQGNFSGDPFNPTGMHLHFSIVRDDGGGNFENELDIDNTYDPTAYLGIESNAGRVGDRIIVCEVETELGAEAQP